MATSVLVSNLVLTIVCFGLQPKKTSDYIQQELNDWAKLGVEGHTDAQGSEQHNLKLSQSRAESVMAYLTSQGVDKERLTGEGKGFSDLLLPEKPKAAENRRVRITTQP